MNKVIKISSSDILIKGASQAVGDRVISETPVMHRFDGTDMK